MADEPDLDTRVDPGMLAIAAVRGVAYLAYVLEHRVGHRDGVAKMREAMLGTLTPFEGENGAHAAIISKVFEEFRTQKAD